LNDTEFREETYHHSIAVQQSTVKALKFVLVYHGGGMAFELSAFSSKTTLHLLDWETKQVAGKAR
jgi:hypothetical protein